MDGRALSGSLLRRISLAQLPEARSRARDAEAEETAARIIADVGDRGETAVREWAERLGELAPDAPLVIDRDGLEAALASLPRDERGILERARDLTHGNGAPMVRVFGPQDMTARGATIAFHLLDPAGETFDVHRMELLAGERGISLRTGCFCNPGDGVVAHRITADDMAACFVEQRAVTFEECDALIRTATGKMPNTMRVSLGLVSDFADVFRFVEFVERYRDVSAREI